MMQRVKLWLSAIIVLVTVIGVSVSFCPKSGEAQAASAGEERWSSDKDWKYQVLDETEKTAILVCANRDGRPLPGDVKTKTLKMPDKIEGYKVVQIGKTSIEDDDEPGAFEEIGGEVENIEIPEGVITLGERCFCLSSIRGVKMPNSLRKIGKLAFAGCNNLTEVTFPGGVTEIEERAFIECNGLTTVVIPDSVTTIGMGVFAKCPALKTAVIGKGVTDLPYAIFNACSSLTDVTLSEGMEHIGESSFNRCSNLTSISLPESLKSISDFAFNRCTSLQKITLPKGVETIGERAFEGCPKLSELKLSESLKTIGEGAFLYNYTVVEEPDTGAVLSDEKIEDAVHLVITIPEGLKDISTLNLKGYEDVIFNVYEGNTAVIQYFKNNGVTKYVTYTLSDPEKPSETQPEEPTAEKPTEAMTEEQKTEKPTETSTNGSQKIIYKVGKTYTIGTYKYKILTKNTVSYAGCKNSKLTKIKIPATVKLGKKSYKVTAISSSVFKGNSKLKQITIGKNVKKIGAKAFMNCKKLKKMSIKTTKLTSIGKKAFKGVRFGTKGIDITVPKGKKNKYTKLIVNAR